MYLYQLGWGPVMKWIPLLILTTEGRKSAMRVTSWWNIDGTAGRFYVVSGWGKNSDWYRNVLENQRVTIQLGSDVLDAKAIPVDNPPEALSALYMFSRNSWIYESLFARMTSAQAADLSTLANVVDEFTVVRLEPSEEAPALPTIEPFSEPVRKWGTICAVLVALWLLVSLARPVLPREEKKRDKSGD